MRIQINADMSSNSSPIPSSLMRTPFRSEASSFRWHVCSFRNTYAPPCSSYYKYLPHVKLRRLLLTMVTHDLIRLKCDQAAQSSIMPAVQPVIWTMYFIKLCTWQQSTRKTTTRDAGGGHFTALQSNVHAKTHETS